MYVCLKINASTYRSTKNPFWNTKTCWREREREQITDTQSTDTPPLPSRAEKRLFPGEQQQESGVSDCHLSQYHPPQGIQNAQWQSLDCSPPWSPWDGDGLHEEPFLQCLKKNTSWISLEESGLWKVDGDCYSRWIKWKSLEELQEGVALSVPDLPCKEGTVWLLTCRLQAGGEKNPNPSKSQTCIHVFLPHLSQRFHCVTHETCHFKSTEDKLSEYIVL